MPKLLKSSGDQVEPEELQIVTFGGPAPHPTPSLVAWLRSAPRPIFSAALVTATEDQSPDLEVLMEGADCPSVGEALESLLAVAAAKLGKEVGDVLGDNEADRDSADEGE